MHRKLTVVCSAVFTGAFLFYAAFSRGDGPPPPPGYDDGNGGHGHPNSGVFDPPDDGGTNDDSDFPSFAPMYASGTNLCLLPPIFLSSNSISLVITNGETNGVYDLFTTTNLSPYADGLNLTNWLWLMRGDPGQTNFALTNLWPNEGYFKLGTMQDSDGDGLTDAYELLVSHTDPYGNDTDGDGLPDDWELAHGLDPRQADTGNTGVPDEDKDPDGDGWTNLEEYQNGTDPNSFNTPRAPQGLRVSSTNGSSASLAWEPSNGAVTNYIIQRDSGSGFVAIATNAVNQLTFLDSSMPDGGTNISYRILAKYTPGNSNPSDGVSPLIEPRYTSPTLIVSGPSNRLYLVVSAMPSGVAAYRVSRTFSEGGYYPLDYLRWSQPYDYLSPLTTNGVFDLSVTNFTNGRARIPDAEAPPFGYYNFTVQAVGQDGKFGLPVDCNYTFGTYGRGTVIPFIDGTGQMKQNLSFLLRMSTGDSFSYEIDAPYIQQDYASDHVYSDYYFHNGYDQVWRNEFQPFEDNYGYRNFVFDSDQLASGDTLLGTGISGEAFPYGLSTNLSYEFPTYHFVTSSNLASIPPILPATNSQWLFYSYLDSTHLQLGYTDDLGVYPSGGLAVMTNGAKTFFGLPYTSFKWPVNLSPVQFETLTPSHSVSPQDGYVYAEVQPPTLHTVDFYFARPAYHSFYPDSDAYYYDWNYRDPLPSDDDFSVTNTTPLIMTTFGQPLTLAGWAKQIATNGDTNKFAYLGQYFDKAYTTTNGVRTTNEAGIVSEYGDFFPTMPGKIILTTKPDLDQTNLQGECPIYVVRMSLDVNHDGIMDESFAGPDNTCAERPFTFWVNNDYDFSSGSADPGGHDVDNPLKANYRDFGIETVRDLEDYARLWISGLPAFPTNDNWHVTLGWNIISGNPAINLVYSAEDGGGIKYLTDTNVADTQINIDFGAKYFRVVSNSLIILPIDLFTNEAPQHFLFEGAGIGKGELVLNVTHNYTNIATTSVFIDLKNIKDMYERMVITNNTSGAISNWTTGIYSVENPAAAGFGDDTNLIVLVHGINVGSWDWLSDSETVCKRLYWSGYRGKFATVKWPCEFFNLWTLLSADTDVFNRSEIKAYKCGTAMKTYVDQLHERYAGYPLHLLVHSQGNAVVGEAIEQGAVFDTYILTEGAISASAYDVNAPPYSGLTNVEALYGPTPEWQPMGYRGVYTNMTGRIVNFYNTNDPVLTVWREDQSLAKPNLPTSDYIYNGTTVTYSPPFGTSRTVTDPQESRAFASRSRTLAIGQNPPESPHGVIQSGIDLTAHYGFADSFPDDHSAQWTWPIQKVWGYYDSVLDACSIPTIQRP